LDQKQNKVEKRKIEFLFEKAKKRRKKAENLKKVAKS
jgi:hypothetical protein